MQTHQAGETMMDSTLKERFFAEVEAEDKYEEALGKALELLRRSKWRRADAATRRAKAEDLIHNAVIATIEGRWQWDPDKRGAVEHIGAVVWSLIANDARLKDSQALSLDAWDEEPLEQIDRDWDALIHRSEPIYVGRSANPEEILIAREEQGQYRKAVEMIYQLAADDPEVKAVLDAMYKGGCERASDVAEALGMRVGDVYLSLQRLRKRLSRRPDIQALYGKVA